MDVRRWSRLTEWAVAAAVVALHLLILVQSQLWPDVSWLQTAGDAQPVVAIALLAAWGLMGPGRSWFRWSAVLLLAFAWMLAMAGGDRRYFNPANSELPLPFSIAIAAALVLGAIRLCGLRMTVIEEGSPEPRPQFSIRALMLATLLVAMTLGGLELLRPTIVAAESTNYYSDLAAYFAQLEANATYGRLEITRGLVPTAATVRQLVLSLAVAGSAAGGLAVVLRPGAIWLRLAIAGVTLPTLAVYLTHLAGAGDEAFATRATEMAVALASVAVLTGVGVLPLRLMGYRLLRGERRAPASLCARIAEAIPAAPACPRSALAASEAST
jgi:hypothetical protein